MKKKVIYQITRETFQIIEVENEAEEMAVKIANRDFERTDKQEKRSKARCTSLETMVEVRGFDVADPDSSVEEYVERNEKIRMVRKVLPMLTEKQREVVILRFWDDKTLEEIAEITGLHISSVEARLECAFKKLRKNLKNF